MNLFLSLTHILASPKQTIFPLISTNIVSGIYTQPNLKQTVELFLFILIAIHHFTGKKNGTAKQHTVLYLITYCT